MGYPLPQHQQLRTHPEVHQCGDPELQAVFHNMLCHEFYLPKFRNGFMVGFESSHQPDKTHIVMALPL